MRGDLSVTIAQAWQDAANTQAKRRLLELSDPNIEIIGPCGSDYGHELLEAWLACVGLTLETKHILVQGDAVALAQHSVWRSQEMREVTGEADLASSFRVSGGVITQFSRHEKLKEALEQIRLTQVIELTDYVRL